MPKVKCPCGNEFEYNDIATDLIFQNPQPSVYGTTWYWKAIKCPKCGSYIKVGEVSKDWDISSPNLVNPVTSSLSIEDYSDIFLENFGL